MDALCGDQMSAGLQNQGRSATQETALLFLESPRALAETGSPVRSPRPAGSPRKKAEEGPGNDVPGMPDEAILRSLLLNPLELKTSRQKHTQAALLRCLVQSFKVCHCLISLSLRSCLDDTMRNVSRMKIA